MIDKKSVKQETYTIEIKALAPIVLKYRVVATSPEEAVENVSRTGILIENPKPQLSTMKRISVAVYKYMTKTLLYSKNF
jgi:hypothetical protein